MPFRNSIAIVASPRPRVGKTLLARLLTDFHLQEGRSRVGLMNLKNESPESARKARLFGAEFTES